MDSVWFTAALWLGLAFLATLLGIWLRVSVALAEITVGILAQFLLQSARLGGLLRPGEPWIAFLAGTGSVVLTFLAGAELDPEAFRKRWKEATAIGLVGFAAPFLGAAWAAQRILGWPVQASWLAGVALSTTSVAVVYAVLLELGLNRTEYGKVILAACFINDLGTVIALGLLFAPFTARTVAFALILTAGLWFLARSVGSFFRRYGGRTSEVEAKLLLLILFALGGLAAWSGSEAVLPAYLIGMALAGSVGRDHALVRRLRTLTFGLLTPFYFIRAGSFVQLPTVLAGFGTFAVLFFAKALSKFVGIFPLTRVYGYARDEGMYTTLLMSTGLTFGTISALYGLTHGILTQAQYSFLVATVIASAVVPTWIANRFFLPGHHIAHASASSGVGVARPQEGM
ncbi:MAG: cation:proton antiporter [Armatimonadota bacterium]|nr:cation:proton antiporter [Armatimonadota bacterium]MDR7568307.1 cation:proton antiporter [Armatimonadota bacterium]MDR7603026.1 cation:proton antiporter [Armatimonadota bacterium]